MTRIARFRLDRRNRRVSVRRWTHGAVRQRLEAHYYGKGDVIVYRLNAMARARRPVSPVFGANVLMLVYGDAFWPTYTTGDNTGLIATDSMKNFIQRETLELRRLRPGGLLLVSSATKFLGTYPQVEGVQVSAVEIPYERIDGVGVRAAGPERATARVELEPQRHRRGGVGTARLPAAAARRQRVHGVRARRVHDAAGSARTGRCTCGSTSNGATPTPARPSPTARVAARVRAIVHDVFETFESGSIQQLIYQMGTQLLADIPTIAEVHLEAQQPHVGYDCRARQRARASTPMRVRRTAAWACGSNARWRACPLTSSIRRAGVPAQRRRRSSCTPCAAAIRSLLASAVDQRRRPHRRAAVSPATASSPASTSSRFTPATTSAAPASR